MLPSNKALLIRDKALGTDGGEPRVNVALHLIVIWALLVSLALRRHGSRKIHAASAVPGERSAMHTTAVSHGIRKDCSIAVQLCVAE